MSYGIVYLIVNEVTGKRYVGQTIKPLEMRFSEHARANTFIGNAIRKYGSENFRCGVVKSCGSKSEMDLWEKFFIVALRTKAPNGYNLTDGGANGWEHTPETCAKISAAHRGKKKSPEHRAHLSAARTGKKLSAQHRAHLSAARRGKKHSPQWCASISAALKGKKKSSEHCAHLSAAHRGKTLVDETRDKMSESRIGDKNHNFGKPRSAETRSKISVGNRGETPFKNLLSEIDNHELTYTDVSKILGINSATVSEKMHGRKNFTESDKVTLAEFFGKPIDYLFHRDDEGGYVKSSSKNRGKSPYKNLKAELETRQLPYSEVANLMGMDKNSFARKMRGVRSFMDKDKKKLAEIFGKPIEYLFERDR